MIYKVKLEKFEGPIDLLLQLIEEQKLDITEVSLAKVADDYLEYVRGEEDISLENLAEFINIASKIILIKSRNIIPSLDVSEEEEKEITDLEEQLREYKKFKDISSQIGKIFGKKMMFSRDFLLGSRSVFSPPQKTNVFDFKKYFQGIIDQVVLPEKIPETEVRDIITLEQKISELQKNLHQKANLLFSQIKDQSQGKVEVIVSFLALLELMKQRIISVEQQELFSEIKIEKNINN